jgi:hypothetical protein
LKKLFAGIVKGEGKEERVEMGRKRDQETVTNEFLQVAFNV